MPIVDSSLVLEIVLIVVCVLIGVYVWNSVKSLIGQIVGAAFLLVALFLVLVAAGVI